MGHILRIGQVKHRGPTSELAFFTSGSLKCRYDQRVRARFTLYALKSPADEALRVEYGIARVHRSLVFCGIADQALLGGEGDVGGRRTVTLCTYKLRNVHGDGKKRRTVVGDDLDTIVLPDTDTSEKTALSIWFAGIEVTQKILTSK